jgi:hypothetical protein
MKVKDLIKKLEGYEDFDLEFNIDCVNLDLKEPEKYFPYTTTINNICLDDICWSDNVLTLGYAENIYFHRVLEMER